MIEEILDEHYYDAMREFAWYTGWWLDLHEAEKIDREDGAFTVYRDKPFIEMTEEEFKELVGFHDEEKDLEDEG